MRLLHAARLSRLADGATGLDKQDEAAQKYANAYGHDLIGVAADTDVSGSVSPWERPKLGPWLERHGEFDGIIASHLDRLGRNARHLTDFHRWAEDHGKALITVEPAIDWSSDVGKLIWQIMAWLAEQELAAITRRNRETQTWLRTNGYLVGKPPFGYQVVAKGEHKTLEPDPVTAPIVRELADRYIGRESLSKLAEWLNEVSPRPGDNRWWPMTVGKMLDNPVYAGRRMSGRDDASKRQVVLRVPPILDAETWAKVRAEAQRREPSPRSAPATDNLLSALLRCGCCHGVMYRHISKGYLYYRCSGKGECRGRCAKDRQPRAKCHNMVRLDKADATVDAEIRRMKSEHKVRQVTPGVGYDAEIADVEDQIRGLDLDAPDFESQLTVLRAERARLKALPAEPATVEYVSTGKTIGDHWTSLDVKQKRQLLADSGFVYYALNREVITMGHTLTEWVGLAGGMGSPLG